MSHAVQNSEDGKNYGLLYYGMSGYNLYFLSSKVKTLPGIRKDNPDATLKDFTHEIPSHQLRLDEVIGGGETYIKQHYMSIYIVTQ